MNFDDLLHQSAPIGVVYDALCQKYVWPSERAQKAVVEVFVDSKNSIHQSTSTLPPPKYIKSFVKLLDKDLAQNNIDSLKRNDEEEVYTDEFAELCVEWLTKTGSDCDDDSGFVSYRPFGGKDRVPILVKRNSNQVGTKVWSAGLVLAEYLPRLLIKPDNTHKKMLSIVELGAGVGISSLLLHASASIVQQPMHITATDCFDAVLEVLETNINSTNFIFPASSLFIHSYNLDWLSIADEDWDLLCDAHLLFAADCTYSPDLNIALVELFAEYFRRYFAKHGQPVPLTTEEAALQLLASVAEGDIPAIIISCTIRNQDTFTHFNQLLLAAKESLHYLDITKHVQQAVAGGTTASGSEEEEGLYRYYIPDREAIKTLLIFPSPTLCL